MTIPNSANYQQLSPVHFLQRCGTVQGQRIAFKQGKFVRTYLEFCEDVLVMAHFLTDQGVQVQDKVALMHNNDYVLLLSHYAVPLIGAYLVPINCRFDSQYLNFILNDIDAKLILAATTLVQNKDLNFACPIHYDYNLFLTEKSAPKRFADYDSITDENEPISINYTSGTNGLPKGVIATHRGTYLNSLGECIQVGLSSSSKFLWTLPMFHCNGWCYTWAVTAVAGTHICIDQCTPESIIATILEENITHLCGAPVLMQRLHQSSDFSKLENSKVTFITAGSAPAHHVIDAFRLLGLKVIHVYGLTETYGPHTINNIATVGGDDYTRQGIASIHGSYVRVVDTQMRDVSSDDSTLGEVVVRGNNVMGGYYKDKPATQNAFAGGWFHTGDLATIDKTGSIKIRDRLKDIIISGGLNIASIRVEAVLLEHPRIKHCAVVAKQDKTWGEVPLAFVELIDEGCVQDTDLDKHCRSLLPGFMCPKEYIFAPIPMTATGKVKKQILRDSIKSGALNERHNS